MLSPDSSSAMFREGPYARPMSGALRALALDIGDSPLAGLTSGAVRRLASACRAFAALIEADPGADARFGPCFLMSVLYALRGGRGPLSTQDEAWILAEVESELDEARARVQARAGRWHFAPAARPPLPADAGGTT